MEDLKFFPEGKLLHTAENKRYTASHAALTEAALSGVVLEGIATLCDTAHNLHVALPCMEGIIPLSEGAIGIDLGETRDIAVISRVGKAVCFTVIGFENTENGVRAILSRRRAQERCKFEYIERCRKGDIIPAVVTRLESFGAFCDIGCGIAALIPIAAMSVSRISHPADRLQVGMDIYGAILSNENGRICLSQRELLGTWEQNAAVYTQGETVMGVVRSVESYGVFVELAPNLAGLAEPKDNVKAGMLVSVYIKSILPEKMKIKLIIIDQAGESPPPKAPTYFLTDGHISRWQYSPDTALKCIETVFDET